MIHACELHRQTWDKLWTDSNKKTRKGDITP